MRAFLVEVGELADAGGDLVECVGAAAKERGFAGEDVGVVGDVGGADRVAQARAWWRRAPAGGGTVSAGGSMRTTGHRRLRRTPIVFGSRPAARQRSANDSNPWCEQELRRESELSLRFVSAPPTSVCGRARGRRSAAPRSASRGSRCVSSFPPGLVVGLLEEVAPSGPKRSAATSSSSSSSPRAARPRLIVSRRCGVVTLLTEPPRLGDDGRVDLLAAPLELDASLAVRLAADELGVRAHGARPRRCGIRRRCR
jgi:hypothetical protein